VPFSSITAQALNARTAVQQTSSGRFSLLGFLRETQYSLLEQDLRVPTACPNDGTPLLTSKTGVLFCPFDGWRQ
jgi:hypothetical protein